ncbi:hypothetical protein BDL97_09G089000 [Sphagnum fallax]|nr:hypothetical protein BDL97_09G089000 [Sphagnum fallax]
MKPIMCIPELGQTYVKPVQNAQSEIILKSIPVKQVFKQLAILSI